VGGPVADLGERQREMIRQIKPPTQKVLIKVGKFFVFGVFASTYLLYFSFSSLSIKPPRVAYNNNFNHLFKK
jgi:hypothetical protein